MVDGTSWLERLRAMDLELPEVARPVAAYVPAVLHGGLIMVSGQLPTSKGQLCYRGRVGTELTVEEGQAAARLCALNALAAAASVAPGGAAALSAPLAVQGFVQCGAEFHDQARVLNGASELLGALFPGRGHSRAAVGCSALPLDAAVEVAMTFAVDAAEPR